MPVVIFLMFIIGAYQADKGTEDCAINMYEQGCYVDEGIEHCKPVVKDYCLNYKAGDFNYKK